MVPKPSFKRLLKCNVTRRMVPDWLTSDGSAIDFPCSIRESAVLYKRDSVARIQNVALIRTGENIKIKCNISELNHLIVNMIFAKWAHEPASPDCSITPFYFYLFYKILGVHQYACHWYLDEQWHDGQKKVTFLP